MARQRNRPESHVLKDFDEDAAEAEHQHRAEDRVAHDANDHLGTLARHRCHQHSLDNGVRAIVAAGFHNAAVGFAQCGFAAQVELDATRIGFVQDIL